MKLILMVLMLALSGALIVVLQFGFIFLLLALMPSIVAYYIDRDSKKSSFKIVFACNFGAALPTLIPMIKAGLKMKRYDSVALFHDPSLWMYVYLGAAAGWCVFFICRHAARFIAGIRTNLRINALKEEQQLLLEEWGQSIMLSSNASKRG